MGLEKERETQAAEINKMKGNFLQAKLFLLSLQSVFVVCFSTCSILKHQSLNVHKCPYSTLERSLGWEYPEGEGWGCREQKFERKVWQWTNYIVGWGGVQSHEQTFHEGSIFPETCNHENVSTEKNVLRLSIAHHSNESSYFLYLISEQINGLNERLRERGVDIETERKLEQVSMFVYIV